MLTDSAFILAMQILILLLCGGVIWLIVAHFPYPSPLIKPLLEPQRRWPEHQVREWIGKGRINKGFFAFFSRDPERNIPQGSELVAPADGPVNDIFKRDDKTYVVIALSFWDVHVQRSPVAGEVISIKRGGDTFMDFEWQNAAFLRDKRSPVQAIVTIRTPAGEVEVRLITSLAARRIHVWVKEGETLTKGQRLGNITFGSTVVMGVPASWPILVANGERVVAGESLICAPAGVSEALPS